MAATWEGPFAMSSSALPRTPAPANPMRQQLDDLDALLQRMLSLPVNSLNEPGGSPAPAAPPAPLDRARPKMAPVEASVSTPQTPVLENKKVLPPRVEQERSGSARNESPVQMRGSITVFQPLSSPGTLTVVTPPPL